MAKQLERVTAKGVASKNSPGYHPDGAGLYLQVSQARTKSWVFRFTLVGRAREMARPAAYDLPGGGAGTC
jgi:hypothetical protein